jgi:hypothetical protein
MPRIAHRPSRPDADRLHRPVHPLEQQIQPASALSGPLQITADHPDKPDDDRGEGFRRQQRLDERQPGLDQRGRDNRHDRLEHRPGRLVQPQSQQWPEPPHQRRAGGGGQGANPFEPQQPQVRQYIGRQAQCLDREIRHDVRTRRHHTAIAKPSDRVRDGGGVGDGGSGGPTLGIQSRYQIAQQPCLAAMQMRAAGDVDPEAVRRIRRHQRCVARCLQEKVGALPRTQPRAVALGTMT